VRGKSIGGALLTRLEAEARLLDLIRVVLETGTRQTEGVHTVVPQTYEFFRVEVLVARAVQ
jgi:hypothetical protein